MAAIDDLPDTLMGLDHDALGLPPHARTSTYWRNTIAGPLASRLLWFGGAHAKGDELTFVEPDRTLVSGDVVQSRVVPGIFRDGGGGI